MRTLFFISLILSAALAYLPSYTRAETGHSLTDKPAVVMGGVPAKPGAVSWSPDGGRLAFITDALNIIDADGGNLRHVHIREPYFVVWTSDGIVLLYRDSGKAWIGIVDPDSLRMRGSAAGIEADVLYQMSPSVGDKGAGFLALSSVTRVTSIGTDVSHRLFAYDRERGPGSDIYTFSRIYPTRDTGAIYLNGWKYAGLNPLDNSLLVIDYVKPPFVRAYSTISLIDPTTGKPTVIRKERRKTYIGGSWSPDGSRLAVTDQDGNLEILDMHCGADVSIDTVHGLYPSWNPGGSQIFLGGDIIDSSGANRRELLHGSTDSLSWWSPDGTKIAVISSGKLYLFKDFAPYFSPADGRLDKKLNEKISLLKELLRQGLLDENEYRERYYKFFCEKDGVRK